MPAVGAPAIFCYKSDTYGRKGLSIWPLEFKICIG